MKQESELASKTRYTDHVKTDQDILDRLQEECAEVIQAVSKIRRFGERKHFDNLEEEIEDVKFWINKWESKL